MAAARNNKQLSLISPLQRRPLRSNRHHVRPTAHRRLLLEVAFRLRTYEVEELEFMVKDVVVAPAGDSLTTLGLLETLERHRLLGPGEYTTLREYLKKIGREDLAALLAPPVEVGASTCTRTSLPGTLARIATRLGINTVVWPCSTYRRNTLEVFRGLSKVQVEQIRWLSQDFFGERLKTSWANEMTGVELLNALECSCLLGPGNYTFLIDCLEEIGRPDLMIHIMPPSLPHLPASMDIPALLHHGHVQRMQLKKTQYQFGMKCLKMVSDVPSKITAEHAGGWYKQILGGLSPKPAEANSKSSYILEKLPDTLINMSLHLNDLHSALSEYESNGDTAAFAQYISASKHHLDILQGLMEEIDWDREPRRSERTATSRQYHPVRQASYGAFSGIAELLLEFSGSRERLQEESRLLSCALTRIESLLFLCGYMWSLTSWMIATLQVAVCAPVCLTEYDFLFRLLLHRNRQLIWSNSRMLDIVLGPTSAGKRLLKCFKQGAFGDKTDQISHPFHVAATPFPVFAFVLLLLSEHPTFSAEDMEEIIESLKYYVGSQEQTFCRIYDYVTAMVLRNISRNIETFRHAKLQEFQSQDLHGIEEIFSF